MKAGERCQVARAPQTLKTENVSLKAKVQVGWEHGCSQSEESLGVIAEIALEIASKKATLKIETFEGKSFGPSPSRYRQGDHDFVHQSFRRRRIYSGTSRREGEKMILELDQVESATDPSGGINYGKPEKATISHTITCTDATLGVLPPVSSDSIGRDEAPQCSAVVLCSGLLELVSLPFEQLTPIAPRALVDGALPLIDGAGIDIDVRNFHSSDWTSFRRAK